MKKILFIILHFFSIYAVAQTKPAMEMKIFPKYIEGSNTGIRYGLPYVCRAKITGLNAGMTYRYFNRYVIASTSSQGSACGMYILPPANVKPGIEGYTPNDFYRAPTSTSGNNNGATDFKDYYGLLTADNDGAYEGWFVMETVRYLPAGTQLYFRISLNNPAVDSTVVAYDMESPEDQPLTVISISANANADGDIQKYGTGMRSTSATAGIPKNMVFLYDNVEGSGRPVAGTFIENDGVLGIKGARGQNGYAPFYYDSVNTVNGAWGTIIPNSDANGIRRIEQRSLIDGAIVGYDRSADGSWADGAIAGGTIATKNVKLGSNSTGTLSLVLDGNQVTLAVPKKDQVLSFTNTFPSALKVGDADFTLAAESSVPELSARIVYSVNPAGVFEITGNTVKIVGGGTATITASSMGNTAYGKASVTKELSVDKANQAIVNLSDLAKNYGDAAFTLPLNTSAGLPVSYAVSSGDAGIVVINGNQVSIKGAGSVGITASQPGNSAINPANEVSVTITIDKALLTISANEKSMSIGQAIPALTYTATGFKYKDAASDLATPVIITTNAPEAPPAGIYDITVSGATSPNYIIRFVNSKLGVYTSEQNVTFNPLPAKIYGDGSFDPGAVSIDLPSNKPVYTSSNPVVAIIENGMVKIVGAGTAVITASFPAGTEVPPSTVDQSLVVAKKDAVITANGTSRMYGYADPAFTSSYSGFVNGDNESALTVKPSYTSTATVISPVGVYVITPKDAIAANYSFTYQTGALAVQKAVLNVTTDSKTRKYGEANPAFTIVYSGFMNGDTEAAITTKAVASVTVTPSSPVGAYPVFASGAAADNYTFNYVNGTLTITAATRTITMDDLITKKLESADFDPSAVLSSNETAVYTSSNIAVATIINGKVHITGAGNTLIKASAPSNANYSNTPSVEKVLVVSKSGQTITFTIIPPLRAGGGAYTFKATASSGLPVVFSLSDSSLGTLNGYEFIPLHAGSLVVTAIQAGNANYLAAVNVTASMSISGSAGELLNVRPALSVNGDGVNDYLVIDGIKDYPQNRVTIVNRNGQKIYSVEGYDNKGNVFRGLSNSGQRLPEGTYFCLVEYNVKSKLKSLTSYFVLKY